MGLNKISHPTCEAWEKKIEEMQSQTNLDMIALVGLGSLINELIDSCVNSRDIRNKCREEVASIYKSIGREELYEN